MSEHGPAQNTDRELWRVGPDGYAYTLFVTESGAIGIQVGGFAIVRPLREWHIAARIAYDIEKPGPIEPSCPDPEADERTA